MTIIRNWRLVSLISFVAGAALLGHGYYKLNDRDTQEARQNKAYESVLSAVSEDRMEEVRSTALTALGVMTAHDPRVPQVLAFLEEATAREVVRLSREGSVAKAEELLSDLEGIKARVRPVEVTESAL